MSEIRTGMTIFFMFFILCMVQIGAAIWYWDSDKLCDAITTGVILALVAWQIRKELDKEEASDGKEKD